MVDKTAEMAEEVFSTVCGQVVHIEEEPVLVVAEVLEALTAAALTAAAMTGRARTSKRMVMSVRVKVSVYVIQKKD